MPTDRISFPKHLGILRAFAVASGDGGRPVQLKEVGALVGLTESTTTLCVPFFVDSGLVARTTDGYVPCAEVRTYNQAMAWEDDSAAHKLAPVLRKTWFGELLVKRALFRPIEADEALLSLAAEGSLAPTYRSQLEMILDYMIAVGLLVRNGSLLGPGPMARSGSSTPPPPPWDPKPEGSGKPKDGEKEKDPPPPSRAIGAGAINFAIDVQVSMSDLAGWTPERITAFFAGVAQVLAAKGQEKP